MFLLPGVAQMWPTSRQSSSTSAQTRRSSVQVSAVCQFRADFRQHRLNVVRRSNRGSHVAPSGVHFLSNAASASLALWCAMSWERARRLESPEVTREGRLKLRVGVSALLSVRQMQCFADLADGLTRGRSGVDLGRERLQACASATPAGPRVAAKLLREPGFGPDSARIRPRFDQSWPSWAQRWRSLAKLGQHRRRSAR